MLLDKEVYNILSMLGTWRKIVAITNVILKVINDLMLWCEVTCEFEGYIYKAYSYAGG